MSPASKCQVGSRAGLPLQMLKTSFLVTRKVLPEHCGIKHCLTFIKILLGLGTGGRSGRRSGMSLVALQSDTLRRSKSKYL